MDFSKIASDERLQKTADSLKANGMNAFIVENAAEAKAKAFELIPEGSEVMTMTSVTLTDTGIAKEFNESGKFDAVMPKLYAMDRATQSREMRKLGAAPDFVIGSVHAIDEDGIVYVASNSASQLPAYAYAAGTVVWVVGAQKVVGTKEEAMQRLYDYVLPLESERAKKAYGVPGSFISKLLIVNREVTPNRINVIIVKEQLGY